MSRKILVTTLLLIAAITAVSCTAGQGSPTTEPSPTSPADMPNPASVYCEENGGTLEMRENPAGTVGICVFPDGSECEEWTYYRGECRPGDSIATAVPMITPQTGLPNPASVYCEENGGTLELRSDRVPPRR
jgi:putative hemolysin